MARSGQSSDDLDAIIARTALKYDLLPYQSKPFAQSQPVRLGALARLFGLAAAPLATARVREPGCASGGNIIPLAFRYPAAPLSGSILRERRLPPGAHGLLNWNCTILRFTARVLPRSEMNWGNSIM